MARVAAPSTRHAVQITPSSQPVLLFGGGAYGYQEEAIRLIQQGSDGLYTSFEADGGVDLSGFGHVPNGGGSITFGGYTADNPVLGKTQATTFDNVDDSLQYSDAGSTAFSGNQRTHFGWARRVDTLDTDTLVAQPGSGSTQAQMHLLANGDLQYYPAGSGSAGVLFSTVWPGIVSLNQWVFWAMVSDNVANTITLYLNGAFVSTQSLTWTWPTSGSYRIGARATSANPWNGQKYGYGVATYALTPADIARLASYGPNPPLAANGQSSAANVLIKVKTGIPLQTSTAQADASAAITAKTGIQLQPCAAQSGSTAAVSAQTNVALQTSGGQSSATAAVSAPTQAPLQTSDAQSAATLVIKSTTQVPLQTSDAQSAAVAALSAKTGIQLQASAAQASALAALTAATAVVLQSSAAQAVASAAFTAQTQIPLQSSDALSLAQPLVWLAILNLQTSEAVSDGPPADLRIKPSIPRFGVRGHLGMLIDRSALQLDAARGQDDLKDEPTVGGLDAQDHANELDAADSETDIDKGTGRLTVHG